MTAKEEEQKNKRQHVNCRGGEKMSFSHCMELWMDAPDKKDEQTKRIVHMEHELHDRLQQ